MDNLIINLDVVPDGTKVVFADIIDDDKLDHVHCETYEKKSIGDNVEFLGNTLNISIVSAEVCEYTTCTETISISDLWQKIDNRRADLDGLESTDSYRLCHIALILSPNETVEDLITTIRAYTYQYIMKPGFIRIHDHLERRCKNMSTIPDVEKDVQKGLTDIIEKYEIYIRNHWFNK